MREKRKGIKVAPEEEDLGKGNLFATGLVAGGALAGVIVAFLSAFESTNAGLQKVNTEHGITNSIGEEGYKWLGVAFFALMSYTLYKVAIEKKKT
jgi:RsiW-degrading membrane proteinase PrsW (M82 family)